MVREAVRREKEEAGLPSSMTVHLPKAWAPLWGARPAPLFDTTAGICPGTGSSGESESAVCLLVLCVSMCVLQWGVGDLSQPSFSKTWE